MIKDKSTQTNSRIAGEAFDLLCGMCPEGCPGELVIAIYQKNSWVQIPEPINLSYSSKTYYSVCKVCNSKYKI